MIIRKTNPNDNFEEIGNIYANSWKQAYHNIVPQSYLDELDSSVWIDFLSNGQNETYVILEDGKYIGTSSICPARDKKMTGFGEIISIYLLPEYFGAGYAEPLFTYVIDTLVKSGFCSICLWVLDENQRAKSFYEKQGFNPDGSTAELTIGGKSLKEIRYVKHY